MTDTTARTTYRPTPCVLSPHPLGTSFPEGAELPIRARDDLDPCSPPLEYSDGRISWDGWPTRDARDAARVQERERETVERAAKREQRRLEHNVMLRERQRERQRLANERVARCSRHEPAHESRAYGFTGPVSRDQNRAAHGNIMIVETCRCGAQRRVNRNGCHVECGTWSAPVLDEEVLDEEVDHG